MAKVTIINPYQFVNWATFNRYKSDLHMHSMKVKVEADGKLVYCNGRIVAPDGTELQAGDPTWNRGNQNDREAFTASSGVQYGSDGRAGFDQIATKYTDYDFHIISLTDHDSAWISSSGRNTWPLSLYLKESASAYEGYNCERYTINSKNLLVVRGNEFSVDDHRVVLFTDMWVNGLETGYNTIEASLIKVEDRLGFHFMAHPLRPEGDGHIGGKDGAFYAALRQKFSMSMGMEVVSNNNLYPLQENLWDDVLMLLMPYHNWHGYSHSDDHDHLNISNAQSMGRNYNTMLMSELSPMAFRRALVRGESYITYDPLGTNVNRHNPVVTPIINSISVNEETGKITISASNATSIEWIHNKQVIGTGSEFTIEDDISYVRAKLHGVDESYALTQPFGIITQEITEVTNEIIQNVVNMGLTYNILTGKIVDTDFLIPLTDGKFVVRYDSNAGQVIVDETRYEADETATVAANTFTKEGYNFVKWNTKADGSGTDYSPADEIVMTTNITLYAIWEVIPEGFTVTYEGNGTNENVPVDENTYESGATVTVLSAAGMINTGYSFASWNTASDGSGTEYAAADTFEITEDVTLYAIWQTNDIDVVLGFLYNGYACEDAKGLVPTGTRLPTIDEYNLGLRTLVGTTVGGNKLKGLRNGVAAPSWASGAGGVAEGNLGFEAYPAGWRTDDGVFERITDRCGLSHSQISEKSGFIIRDTDSLANVSSADFRKRGYSVRVIITDESILNESNQFKDIDGNWYGTVVIEIGVQGGTDYGTLRFSKQNLKVTKFRNGDPIPYEGADGDFTNAEWAALTSPGMCPPNGDWDLV